MALTYGWNRNTAPAAAAALLLAAVTLAGCGARGREVKAEAAAKPRDTSEIVAAGELAALVKAGAVQQSEVAAKLRVPGRVEADETRIARVNSPVGGRIIDLEVVEGQTVKRGQLIAVISSTQLTDAQSSYLKAISQRRLAERAVDRA
jgi:cobalt-zinc-cadmium efflux system membrane fusion protein